MAQRVLVVTSRATFAEPLSLALRAADLDYSGARGQRSAERQIAAAPEHYAAVVIDLLTVQADAGRICDAVRARKDGSQVPVLFIGNGAQDIRSTTDALIAGGDAYLTMPLPAATVLAKLAAYIGCPVPELPADLVLETDTADLVSGEDDADALPTLQTAAPGTVSTGMSPEEQAPADDEEFEDAVTDTMSRAALEVLRDTARTDERKDEPPTVSSADDAASAERDEAVMQALAETPWGRTQGGARRESDTPEGGVPHPSASSDTDDVLTRKLRAHSTGPSLDEQLEETRRLHDAQTAKKAAQEAQELQRAQAAQAEAVRLQVEQRERAEQEARAAEAAKLRAEQELRDAEAKRALAEQERQRAEQERLRAEQEARRIAEERLAQEERRLREEAELAAAEARRRAAQEEAERAEREHAARAAQERARIDELAEQRKRAEADIARTAAVAAERVEQERARLVEIEAERRAAEAAAEHARLEVARREGEERARLWEMEQARIAAEADAERLVQEARQREADERARIAALEEQRRQLELLSREALAQAEAREAAERERLQALLAQREEAEAVAHRTAEEVRARESAEQSRLDALILRREEAEAAVRRTLQDAQAQEEAERARLLELERRRQEAEQNAARAEEEGRQRFELAAAALKEAEARAHEESARADALERRRLLAEAETKRSIAELEARAQEAALALDRARAQEHEEQQRLLALKEMMSAAALAFTEREASNRAALRVLEEEQLRKQHDALTLSKQREQQEEAERLRLNELEAMRARLEDEARRTALVLEHKEREESIRLAALQEARAQAEREMQATLRERERLAAIEEARIQELTLQRLRAEDELKEQALRGEQEAIGAEQRLQGAMALRAQVEVETAAELERLQRLRVEEELARRELLERRERARLSFQTGRLDALPPGDSVGGVDVGSARRPQGDGEGTPMGGTLLPIILAEQEPPPPPPFAALEPPQGRFGEGELPALLWACHALKVTGAVDITLDDGRRRRVHLEAGEPVLVSSTLPVDRPEEALLRAGLVTTTTYNALRAGPLLSARRAAANLVSEGLLKVEELFPAIRGALTEQVLSLLEWESGAFAYVEEHAHASDRVRLEHGFDALLAEAIRRKYDERRLWGTLGGPATLLAAHDRARALPPLSPEEKLAVARLDGTRALDDVILESGLSAAVVLRAAFIGITCGALRVLARGVPLDPNERIAQRDRGISIDRARVVDRLHAARHGDYYTFLGVDLHASAFEVHRAAERLRQRFDPARFADPAFSDLRAALVEIVEVTHDAEAVLSDEGVADGYRRSLVSTLLGAPAKKRA